MKDFMWYWPKGRKNHIFVSNLYPSGLSWVVSVLGLGVEYYRNQGLFITTWGPILERRFMLWLRWPLWNKSPKGIVLWRKGH